MLPAIPQGNNNQRIAAQRPASLLLDSPKEIVVLIACEIPNVSDLCSFSRASKFCLQLVSSLPANNFNCSSAVHKRFLIGNLFNCGPVADSMGLKKIQITTQSHLGHPEEDEKFTAISKQPKKTKKTERGSMLSLRRINMKINKTVPDKKSKTKLIAASEKTSFSTNKAKATLSSCAKTLIQATFRRGITSEESLDLHCPLFNECESQCAFNFETLKVATLAEQSLYEEFKSRCAELDLDINSPLFSHYLNALFAGLKNYAYSEEIDQIFPEFASSPEYRNVKIGYLIYGLQLKFHRDMIHSFAQQDIQFITKENCKMQVENLQIIFPDILLFDTELALSHALNTIHGLNFYQSLTK